MNPQDNPKAEWMLKSIVICNLIFVAVLFCFSAGAEIIKVNGHRVLIRLNGKSVLMGEELDVVDADGRKRGIVKVTTFNETGAFAEIESGVAMVGMRVARRAKTTEKSSYHPSGSNTFDFRINPVGIVAGGIDANLDVRIAEDWTVGVQGIYLHLNLSPSGIYTSDYNMTAYGFGVRANWFSNGALNDGFYFGPSLEYLNLSLKTTDASGSASGIASGLMASGLIGYGWFWQHFNILLGGGYGAVLGASGITIQDAAGSKQTITANLSGLTYELSIGWAF